MGENGVSNIYIYRKGLLYKCGNENCSTIAAEEKMNFRPKTQKKSENRKKHRDSNPGKEKGQEGEKKNRSV